MRLKDGAKQTPHPRSGGGREGFGDGPVENLQGQLPRSQAPGTHSSSSLLLSSLELSDTLVYEP